MRFRKLGQYEILSGRDGRSLVFTGSMFVATMFGEVTENRIQEELNKLKKDKYGYNRIH